MTAPRAIEILLVEDNEWDARIAAEAFAAASVPVTLHLARDGVEAMEFLRAEGKFKAATRPDVVLLDLNLPRKDGREVLAELKADPGLTAIPVIVLTTSKADSDIVRAYNLHANAYLNKPVDPDEYPAVVKAVEEFWFLRAILPPKVTV